MSGLRCMHKLASSPGRPSPDLSMLYAERSITYLCATLKSWEVGPGDEAMYKINGVDFCGKKWLTNQCHYIVHTFIQILILSIQGNSEW